MIDDAQQTKPGIVARLVGWVERLAYGITHPDEELTRLQRLVRYYYELFNYAARQLGHIRAPLMAAALAYRTLFSLIPLLVLSLVVLQGFVEDKDVEKLLSNLLDASGLSQLVIETPQLAPPQDPAQGTTQAAENTEEMRLAVDQWIEQFVASGQDYLRSISFGSIAVVGVFVFIYAAISLFLQIEQCFNAVYKVTDHRGFWIRIVYSWTLMSLGSVTIAASILLAANWASVLDDLPAWLAWSAGPIRAVFHVGITWLLFFVAYQFVPDTRVGRRAAAIGALTSAVLFELSKWALVWFVSHGIAGQVAIYSSLALIPLVLLWLYVVWMIVIFGLQVAQSIQTLGSEDFWLARRAPEDQLIDPLASVALLRHVAQAFNKGEVVSAEKLARTVTLQTDVVLRIMGLLAKGGFVHELSAGDDAEDRVRPGRYVLARPPERINLADAIDALHDRPPADAELTREIAVVRSRQREALGGITLAELADANHTAETPQHEPTAAIASPT